MTARSSGSCEAAARWNGWWPLASNARKTFKSISDVDRVRNGPIQDTVQLLVVPVRYFAWHAGYFNEELVRMAKEVCYQALFTVLDGATRPGDDPLKIRHLFINGSCGQEGFQQTCLSGQALVGRGDLQVFAETDFSCRHDLIRRRFIIRNWQASTCD